MFRVSLELVSGLSMKQSIAVVGCGHWGKNLVRNFAELDSLYAVCDPDRGVAAKFSGRYAVNNLSFVEVLADTAVEGVVLAVPAPLHASMAVEAMNARKHVFVEKPIAMNRSQAEEMILASNKNGVQLMVGHLLQYHPVFISLRALVEQGALGEVQYIYSSRLSFGKVRSEEDVIWSFAPHDLSMILSLTPQEPEIIRAESSRILQTDIADMATIHMEFKSGLKAHILTSWLNPFKEQKLVVIGDRAMAVFDDTRPWSKKLALYPHTIDRRGSVPIIKEAEASYLEVPQSEPLRSECEHFLNVVNENVMPLTNGEEGLRVLRVLSAASLSESENKSVRIGSL